MVTDVLDATAYYGADSAHRERPDCIYRYDADSGELVHNGRSGLHADPRHRRRDLGRDGLYENARILLCREYTYLGAGALVIPQSLHRLRELASALGQGHRVIACGKDKTLDAEVTALFRRIGKQTSRFTPAEVHADAYDHPAPAPADRRLSQRDALRCHP